MGSVSPPDDKAGAIIGLAARFAQESTDINNFWESLLRARQSSTPFPKDRMDAEAYYHPDSERNGMFHVQGAHFLSENPSAFDAGFFNIGKTELLSLDPQQRLVLESVYHALENAGIPMETAVSSNTGVFASGCNMDYFAALQSETEAPLKYRMTGSANSIIANRVSYFFDFKGPSLSVDTACSTSMVALHLALQSLQSGECEMAIVTAPSIILLPATVAQFDTIGFLGEGGRSYSFDARAEGFARGEGVSTIVIKRVSKALLDENTIRAIFNGTATNQDGRTLGMTLPSASAQYALITKLYRDLNLDPMDTMMVEAHGTGTAVGDPIEMEAITSAFEAQRRDVPLYIGAVKASIGHQEGGAGLAGIIKSVLILESGVVPPNADFEQLNPKIASQNYNMLIPTKAMPWPASSGPRRISVNSFGMGGTNGTCVLEDAANYLARHGLSGNHRTRIDTPTIDDISRMMSSESPNGYSPPTGKMATFSLNSPQIFALSSFDKKGLNRLATNLAHFVRRRQAHPNILPDLAYTLSEKRSKFPWKRFLVAESADDLISQLERLDSDSSTRTKGPEQGVRIGYVLTGQGAQFAQMGRQFLSHPVFRNSLQAATEHFRSLGSSWDLMDELARGKETSRVHEPFLAHPALVAIQMAFIDLLSSWGVYPSRVVGHSSGEIPAAYCAGNLSQQGAWTAAYFRGYVSSQQTSRKGSMVAVGLEPTRLQAMIDDILQQHPGVLTVACYNSPKNCTVSGDDELVNRLMETVDSQGIFFQKLRVKNAYHSAHMQEVADQYLALMGELPGGNPSRDNKVSMFSTVTGRLLEDGTNASYFVENLVSPVRFTDALNAMCFEEPLNSLQESKSPYVDVIIEIGPHSSLRSSIKDSLSGSPSPISSLSVSHRNEPGTGVLLNTMATLWTMSYDISLERVNLLPRLPSSYQPQMLVDLTPYPFLHDDSKLYEGRLTKNIRFPKAPRHSLFGAPVHDWDDESPRWRHHLRVSDNPWLRDHVVTGNVVFPGVGYVVMAIEASRQLADAQRIVKGVKLRDIAIKAALVVPDTDEGIEVSLSMTGATETNIWKSSIWRDFQIRSYNPTIDAWVEHCSGYVSIEYDSEPNAVEGDRENQANTLACQSFRERYTNLCHEPVDSEYMYSLIGTSGLEFGPSFQNLGNLLISGQSKGTAMGIVTLPDILKIMPYQYMSPHLIHPAALDSMIHGLFAAGIDLQDSSVLRQPLLPVFIKEVWVSAGVSSAPGTQLQCYANAKPVGHGNLLYDVKAWEEGQPDWNVSITGLRTAPIRSNSDDGTSQVVPCHTIQWAPDVSYLSSDDIYRLPLAEDLLHETGDDALSDMEEAQLASLLLITDALFSVKDLPVQSVEKAHLRTLFEWMKQVAGGLITDSIIHAPFSQWKEYSSDPALKQALYQKVAEGSCEGALLLRMGRNLPSTLRGQTDPLDLMFAQDDLITRTYEEATNMGDMSKTVDEYIRMLGRTSNNIRALEIGAGTGSFTKKVLRSLCPESSDNKTIMPRISNYCFTDLSTSFFPTAKETFTQYEGLMSFEKLDIEQDPESQGFPTGEYDLIIACNVLHATKDLHITLKHAHKLLKPGGKLFLFEGVRSDLLSYTTTYGSLPGWWLSSEPSRRGSPYISVQQWNTFLEDAGFSGVDLVMANAREESLFKLATMVSTSLEQRPVATDQQQIVLICPDGTSDDDSLYSDIGNDLQRQLCTAEPLRISPRQLQSLDIYKNTIYVSLLELTDPFLASIQEDDFNRIKNLLLCCQNLIWVTGSVVKSPHLAAATGLIRTLRWERDVDDINFLLLEVEQDLNAGAGDLASALSKIIKRQFVEVVPQEANGEFKLRDNIIHTNRVTESPEADSYFQNKSCKNTPTATRWKDIEEPVRLENTTPGLLNRMQWVPDHDVHKPLGASEIEVDVRAVGVNFKDLLALMGEVPEDTQGIEASGIVTQTGCDVSGFQAGDRVVFLSSATYPGTFRTLARTYQELAIKLPDSLSFEVAAGLPCTYGTVIYSLSYVCKLARGDKILIHAAAGGVGQAAIQFAKTVGAEIFVTVSSAEKKALMMDHYGIPEDHIFSSRELSFARGVMRVTRGQGVDVILNSLSGEMLQQSWKCIAPFGTFIEIGKKDIQAGGQLDMGPFLCNVTFAAVDLGQICVMKPVLMNRLLQDMMALWQDGSISGTLETTFLNYGELERGFRMLQSGKSLGKIVFTRDDDALVPYVRPAPSPYEFQPDGSYLLAGGLGGLGRSLAQWMASRGAKQLIFLTRSAQLKPEAQELIHDLEEKGCKANVYVCDVANEQDVLSMVQKCEADGLPPIRGCIQCSMALKDSVFENMTFSDWETATRPKIQGSWNLEIALSKTLDFYIMLSSISGIAGNRSQANYAAGNTFQDALAQYRTATGSRGTSIDLGVILDVGFVAEHQDYANFSKLTPNHLRPDDVLALIEYSMDSRWHSPEQPAQLIRGLSSRADFEQNAISLPEFMRYPLFTNLHDIVTAGGQLSSQTAAKPSMQVLLRAATNQQECVEIVLKNMIEQLASLSNTADDQLDPHKSLRLNGVDSLITMEFRTWLVKEVGADISLIDMMAKGSMVELAEAVTAMSKYVQVTA